MQEEFMKRPIELLPEVLPFAPLYSKTYESGGAELAFLLRPIDRFDTLNELESGRQSREVAFDPAIDSRRMPVADNLGFAS